MSETTVVPPEAPKKKSGGEHSTVADPTPTIAKPIEPGVEKLPNGLTVTDF